MSDQIPQDLTVETTDAGQQSGQGTQPEQAPQTVAEEGPTAIGKLNAGQVPALNENRTFAYGAIAATVGIVFGLGFAALAGHGATKSVAAASTSGNSNAAALASLVKPGTASPADVSTKPVESPAAQTPSDPQPKPASHRKAKKKDLEVPARFAIEGDDELVGYDTSKGVIQTSARKTFLVTVTSVGGTSSAWQEWPANIHYKCDLNSSCTLTRRGGAVLYAQLKK